MNESTKNDEWTTRALFTATHTAIPVSTVERWSDTNPTAEEYYRVLRRLKMN